MAFVPFVETDQPTMENFNEKFRQCINEAVASGLQMVTGSYVGTGLSGVENPFSIALPFRPMVFLLFRGSGVNWLLEIDNPETGYSDGFFDATGRNNANNFGYRTNANITDSGITITENVNNGETSVNIAGVTYRYLAIGEVSA